MPVDFASKQASVFGPRTEGGEGWVGGTGPVGYEGVGFMSDCAADVAGGRGGGGVLVAGCPDITLWFTASWAKTGEGGRFVRRRAFGGKRPRCRDPGVHSSVTAIDQVVDYFLQISIDIQTLE